MISNLANQLREGTTKSHSMAENVSFVKSFLSGVVDKNSYKKLVANLYFVYSAIEEEIENNKYHFAIEPIYFPELNRKESLEKDLTFYYGNEWEKLVEPSAATQTYINRIHQISQKQPELLVAHAYTRYLGDLSGGQILKRIAQSAMQLSSSDGVEFYNFRDIKDEKSFKHQYRAALNSIPVNDQLIAEIISEANVSFNLNMKIFQELNSSLIKIFIMLLLNTIGRFNKRKQY
uniref:Heme oxygenase n=1 Tax=Rhodochaete parvula TaxID=110510 RepID=A0A1X9PV37_9RHOD|nr:heme oxygenase [Rhodochaete parvula]ASK39718.1 heme oxygenase [Rhodochaete parvula]|eukprot:Plantae.Rhodophyta-Rhodochaete_pulchella.ctg24757.p2 GENE.Plantae.Rhodophyta-Rhodochaete_pulchella.ctg24757~~Plantae.Rhodophyta-Rhodochaete_pulchella.ctg24757.p2  ORF type:complete len:233 (-),score=1.43 Plantae.Rhodophyta-Rhodochaete_pulchella.ctg24757:389-1087(-)